jgi:Flp pilus assembly protein TadD
MCRADCGTHQTAPAKTRQFISVAPVVLAALLLGACANAPKIGDSFTVADAKRDDKTDPSKPAQTELEKAIEYWGKEYAKSPRDLKLALNYAKNLKAAGQKDQALGVLQAASTYHGANRELASEYGRLALDMGQAGLAQQLLAAADDPAKPDWKIISARGTALAKQGQFKQAIPLYERALELSPNQPSVVSNLAMAHAANGEAPRAELMLRKVAQSPDSDPKVRQNLALVLGLQGKYDEARAIAAKDIPQDSAAANVEYVRQMVRAEPQAAPKATPAVADANANALRGPATEAGSAGGAWATSVTTASLQKTPTNSMKPSQR